MPQIAVTPDPPWTLLASSQNYCSADVYTCLASGTSQVADFAACSGSEVGFIAAIANSGTPAVVQSVVFCSSQAGAAGANSITSPALPNPTTTGHAILALVFTRQPTNAGGG